METDLSPRYPFGYGLSYTTFEYLNLKVEPAVIDTTGEAVITVQVTNTGTVAGAEVVQLYVSDLAASVTRPEKALKRFEKIELEPGETREVDFLINREQLELIGLDLQPVVEPGAFDIIVGPNSVEGLVGRLTVE